MDEIPINWTRERATNFVSCAPNAPLTDEERAAVDRMIGDASVVALGEATHGAKEIIDSQSRVLRYLIEERMAAGVVLEACFAATQPLNRYVMHGSSAAQEAIVATSYWSYANHETLGFVEWLRSYNSAPPRANRPVRIYGCDVQSIDEPKTELVRLLQIFGRAGRLAPAVVAKTTALLAALPTDRDLFGFVELLMAEGSANHLNESRGADIQAQQSVFMAAARLSVEELSNQLHQVQAAFASTVLDDDLFVFERCRRSLEQAVEFYSPGGLETRDRRMAENVAALRRQFGSQRLIILAHNLHVARAPLTIRGQPFLPMGCHLAAQLGRDYRVIGSAFYAGAYLAVAGDRPGQDAIVVAPPPGPLALESILQQVAVLQPAPGLLVDLSGGLVDQNESPWPNGELEMRTGEAFVDGNNSSAFMRQRPELLYDGMIFLKETRPITVLPTYYQHADTKWKRSNCGSSQ